MQIPLKQKKKDISKKKMPFFCILSLLKKEAFIK